MRIYVPLFTDAYLRPNPNLAHKPATKFCAEEQMSFLPKACETPIF
jgi:hypothetical protein